MGYDVSTLICYKQNNNQPNNQKDKQSIYIYIYFIDQYNLGSYPWSYQK